MGMKKQTIGSGYAFGILFAVALLFGMLIFLSGTHDGALSRGEKRDGPASRSVRRDDPGASAASGTANWNEYVSDEFFVRFRYPDTFRVEIEDTGKVERKYLHDASRLFGIAHGKWGDSNYTSVNVSVMMPFDSDGNRVENLDAYVDMLASEGMLPIERTTGKIGGLETIEFSFEADVPGTEFRRVYALGGGVIYEIQLYGDQKAIADVASTFSFFIPETFRVADAVTAGPTEYRNIRLGFAMTFPAGWYLPSPEDDDPHMYACPNYDCDAFEVWSLSVEGIESEAEFRSGTWADGYSVRSAGDIVPGAVSVVTGAMPGSDWRYGYAIYFPEARSAFYVFTNNEKLVPFIVRSIRPIGPEIR
jgi:hypothetical protein